MRTLTINSVDCGTYGATLLSIDWGYSTVTTYKDWLRNAKNPIYYGQDQTYTTAEIKFLVEGTDYNDLDRKSSNLVAAMKKCVIKVSDCDFYLDGDLVDSKNDKISSLAREVNVSLEGVKIAETDTQTHVFKLNEPWELDIKGNSAVPCVIKIVPEMGYTSLDMTINDKTFKVKNVLSSVLTLVIDSVQGTILQDDENKIEDYEAWEFPYLQPGKNIIKINGTPTVTITYNGRWM